MNLPDVANSAAVHEVAERILAMPRDGRRRLIAVAGAPAGGKSTLAEAVVEAVQAGGRAARAIPMDGFHLDNAILDARGLRHRKGAPETFDAHGFIALVGRISEGKEVVYPLFDRTRDLAVAGAATIGADIDIAVFEGNYLLFDEAPWRDLTQHWDLSVWLDTPEALVTARCVQRWRDHGHGEAAALERAEGNDLPNARRIMAARLPSDITIADSA